MLLDSHNKSYEYCKKRTKAITHSLFCMVAETAQNQVFFMIKSTCNICRQFLNRNNVNVLPWPAGSPDMNPIEHIWYYLGIKAQARGNVHNLRDLENALIQEWNNIPNVVIRRYVRSMRDRLVPCINSRGGHTRY